MRELEKSSVRETLGATEIEEGESRCRATGGSGDCGVWVIVAHLVIVQAIITITGPVAYRN